MEETVELIVADAMKRVAHFGYANRSWIINEVVERLREEADTALKMEFFNNTTIDE